MKEKVNAVEMQINESNAVKLAAAGDAAAFSYLDEQHVKRIYNYIYYRIGSEADAEDLTARVFHRAFGRIDKYVDRGVPFNAWLYRIAHNLTANWYRDTLRRHEVSLDEHFDLPQQGDSPEKTLELNQEKEMLLRAIRRLPADRQQLLLLKYLEDLSNNQIAQIMGKTEGAIKSLYHRSLISLREEINKGGSFDETDRRRQGK